jgi:ribosomal protein S12 methylthiotransferase accessory factor
MVQRVERRYDCVNIGRAEHAPSEAHVGEAINTSEFWGLERLRKYSDDGVVRAVHPRSTIRRVKSIASAAGVSRLADVTNLDRLSIPNYMTVRPKDLAPGITYYNGKGTTRDDAHAGALMEAFERHAGEHCGYPIVSGTYAQILRRGDCVHPSELIIPSLGTCSQSSEIEWVCGFELLQRRPTFVPLNAVVTPYRPANGAEQLFYSSTNGLASGNSRTEALCHALCEVVERDSESMSLCLTKLKRKVRALATSLGPATASMPERVIRLGRLPLRARRLVTKMERAGLTVQLHDLTGANRIATIHCTIVDPAWNGPANAHGGCGAHVDARVALLRALTEAAQSRLTCIQGGREDLEEIMQGKGWVTLEEIERRRSQAEEIWFSDIPSLYNEYIDDDVTFILNQLPESDLHRVVAFDLTHPDTGIPVVKVVVPFAETWAVFHVHTGRGRLGRRAARLLEDA